jgi:hypothetical protein
MGNDYKTKAGTKSEKDKTVFLLRVVWIVKQ